MEKLFCKSNIESHSYNTDPRCNRIQHSSTILGEEIYICGGQGNPDQDSPALLRFSCSTNTFDSLSPLNFPQKSGHLMFTLANSLYLWGGQDRKQTNNELWRFSEGIAQSFEQTGSIPCPRIDARAVSVDPAHVLLYGGFSNRAFLNDWYILDHADLTWKQCKIVGDQPKFPLYKPSLCWSFDRGYLFGGQVLSSSQTPQFSDEFYELKFETLQSCQLRLRRIILQGGPCARSSHCSLVHYKRYVFIIGGQTSPTSSDTAASEFGINILQDIWVYDSECPAWFKLDFTLSPRFGFSAQLYKSKIYIFGGAKNLMELSNQLEIIEFGDAKCVDTFCVLCKNVLNLCPKPKYRPLLPQIYKPQPDITLEFISGLTQMIKSPFNAIGLLVDNSFNMGAHSVKIKLVDQIKSCPYLTIQDDSRGFTQKQFLDAVYKFNVRRDLELRKNKQKQDLFLQAEYGSNLKLGGLRLGKNLLFICKNQSVTHIAFISTSTKAVPIADRFVIYDYTFKIKQPMATSDKFNRYKILQVCKLILNEEKLKAIQLDKKATYKKIIVFDMKQVFYGIQSVFELEATQDDVLMRHNLKKLKDNDIDRSLRSYLSLLYLNPYIGRPIYLQQQQVQIQNYQQILKKLMQSQNLKPMKNDRLQQKANKSLLLSIPPSLQNTKQLQGILLYHDNRLFGIYDYQLGGYWDNQQRFKKAGCIEIPHEVQLNILKSEMESSVDRYILTVEVTKAYEEKEGKRKAIDGVNGNGNPPRKILREN